MHLKTDQITTRKATLGDIEFIRTCLIDSWSEHARNTPHLLNKDRLKAFESKDFYIKSIADDEGCFLIAEHNGAQVGLVVAYITKLSYFFIHPQSIYIDDVYVIKDFRRAGVAKILMNSVEEFAKTKGIQRLDNRVYSYNIPMQRLLTKLGYSSPFATWIKTI